MISPDYITHEEIRARAYEIWQERGRPADCDVDIWLQAEREQRALRERRAPEES